MHEIKSILLEKEEELNAIKQVNSFNMSFQNQKQDRDKE